MTLHRTAAVLLAAIVAGCAAPVTTMTPESSTAPAPSVDPIGGGRGAIPRCNNMAPIAAPPEFYPADATIVATDDAPIMDWARARAGFEELWIDRDQHDGWLTFAFSSNVLPTRIELAGAFPGIAAIVVEVPWTMVQLRAVQQRVLAELRPGGSLVSTGIQPQHGVVTIGVAVLLPEVVAEVEAKFGGQPVCIEGGDPKDVPPEGPQAQAGDGWRLLADQDQTGGPYRTGIAADADGYAMLWAEVGLEGDPPHVDFQTEVVVWFGAVHGSSCPRLRLDDVAVDLDQAIVHSVITRWEFGACTADAIGHAYVVAVERAHLPTSGFTIQLQAADPPGGVIDQERTFVPGNLSVAGATIAPR